MYAVYHIDRKGNEILLKVFSSRPEAYDYFVDNYGDRQMPDRDTVEIRGSEEGVLYTFEVDYMPVFDAVKKWGPFKSSSGSGSYITQLNAAGFFSCQCKGWTMKKAGKPRFCKHTTQIIRDEGYDTHVNGDYIFIDDKKLKAAKSKFAGASTPALKFAALVEDYENVIARMAKLEPSKMLDLAEEVEMAKFKVESYMTMLETQGLDAMVAYEAAQAKVGTLLS